MRRRSEGEEAAARRDGAAQRPADPRPDPLGRRGPPAGRRRSKSPPNASPSWPGPRSPRSPACAARSNSPRRCWCCRWCAGGCRAARLPFEDPRVLVATAATLAISSLMRRRGPASASREGLIQAIGAMPRRRRPHRPRPRRLPRCRAQGDRRLRAGGRGRRLGPQRARPLRLQPDRPDDAALGRRNDPARAPRREARAGHPRGGRPGRSLARGRGLRLVGPPPRRAAGQSLPHPRPRDPAPPGDEGAEPRAA